MLGPMSEAEPTTEPGRDWPALVRALLLVLISFAGGLLLLYGVLEQAPSGGWLWVDVIGGFLASLALVLSRRAPLLIALALAGLSAVFASAGVANMLALYALARRRRLGVALLVGLVEVACGCVFWLLYPKNNSLSLTIIVNVAIAAAVTAWGALRQAQQALVDSYRERAERVEREQSMREAEVRSAERTRIAREMHDAVAHRISLVALHAGGLKVAPQPSLDDVRGAADLIRSAAIQALEELRVAVGVLRADEPRSLEQPGLARIPDLVRDAQAAGQRVDVAADLELADDVPPGISQAAYRIVQEGLTNARKHAPGATVTLSLKRADGKLLVRVGNPLVPDSLGVPGSGRGLIGLQERVTLVGGTLKLGAAESGIFELRAELPWM
jgi:signal transduction histidine kinase